MKMRLLFILIFSFVAVVSASAQNQTVTNEDLEKFRQKRLAAEKDYRENYEKMGFPSPEELNKQIEQSRVERRELAARLRAEKLQSERLDLQRQIAESEANSHNLQLQLENSSRSDDDNYYSNYGFNGFYNFPNFGFPAYRSNRFNRGNFRNNRRGNYYNQPRVEYRNNLPVILPPPPRPIFAPPVSNGRRN
ncbi:MAG: hypothetical protein ACR2HG_06085 [Pyrinomonadaceae bacterium]